MDQPSGACSSRRRWRPVFLVVAAAAAMCVLLLGVRVALTSPLVLPSGRPLLSPHERQQASTAGMIPSLGSILLAWSEVGRLMCSTVGVVLVPVMSFEHAAVDTRTNLTASQSNGTNTVLLLAEWARRFAWYSSPCSRLVFVMDEEHEVTHFAPLIDAAAAIMPQGRVYISTVRRSIDGGLEANHPLALMPQRGVVVAALESLTTFRSFIGDCVIICMAPPLNATKGDEDRANERPYVLMQGDILLERFIAQRNYNTSRGAVVDLLPTRCTASTCDGGATVADGEFHPGSVWPLYAAGHPATLAAFLAPSTTPRLAAARPAMRWDRLFTPACATDGRRLVVVCSDPPPQVPRPLAGGRKSPVRMNGQLAAAQAQTALMRYQLDEGALRSAFRADGLALRVPARGAAVDQRCDVKRPTPVSASSDQEVFTRLWDASESFAARPAVSWPDTAAPPYDFVPVARALAALENVSKSNVSTRADGGPHPGDPRAAMCLSRNAVVAVAIRYPWAYVAPLAYSFLRYAGPCDFLHLIVTARPTMHGAEWSNIVLTYADDLRAELQQAGGRSVPRDTSTSRGAYVDLRRRVPAPSPTPSTRTGGGDDANVAATVLPPEVERVALLQHWAHHHSRFYRHIVHVDARDTVFFANPFSALESIYARHNNATSKDTSQSQRGDGEMFWTIEEFAPLRDEHHNLGWLRIIGGVALETWLKEHRLPARAPRASELKAGGGTDRGTPEAWRPVPVLCSGVYGGTSSAFLAFITAFAAVVTSGVMRRDGGLDQGYFNLLIYAGLHRTGFAYPILLLDPDTGPARNAYANATYLGHAAADVDSHGRHRNCRDEVYTFLHQLDRIKPLYAAAISPYRAWQSRYHDYAR